MALFEEEERKDYRVEKQLESLLVRRKSVVYIVHCPKCVYSFFFDLFAASSFSSSSPSPTFRSPYLSPPLENRYRLSIKEESRTRPFSLLFLLLPTPYSVSLSEFDKTTDKREQASERTERRSTNRWEYVHTHTGAALISCPLDPIASHSPSLSSMCATKRRLPLMRLLVVAVVAV